MERPPRPPSPPQPPPGRLAATHTRVPPYKHTSSRRTSGTRSGRHAAADSPNTASEPLIAIAHCKGGAIVAGAAGPLAGEGGGGEGAQKDANGTPGAHWASDWGCGRGRASTPAPRHAPGGGHPRPGQAVRGSSPRLGDRRARRALSVPLRQLPAERGPRFEKENGSGGGHGSQRQTAVDSHSGCHSDGRAGGWVPQRAGRRTPHSR